MLQSKNVICAARDASGKIVSLGGNGREHSAQRAITYIESFLCFYYVNGQDKLVVKDGPDGKYLTTTMLA